MKLAFAVAVNISIIASIVILIREYRGKTERKYLIGAAVFATMLLVVLGGSIADIFSLALPALIHKASDIVAVPVFLAAGAVIYSIAASSEETVNESQIRAQRHVSQGNFAMAKEEIELAIAANPNDALNYYALGVIHYNLKQFGKAQKNLKQAVFIERSNSDAWFLIGRIYYEKYDFDRASKYFEKAVEIDPAMIKARFGLAAILFERGLIDEAQHHYARIIEVDPMNANAHYNLGSCYLEKELYREAIREHEISAGLDTNNAYAYYWIGYSYIRLDDKKRAGQAFARSLERGYEGAAEALKDLI
ncbi:MAG: tetratricopeptide repeat protein [Actinobacteria bacterium]|nr:tetratricopeptide repeat protein [Actinomycetota bacterium]